VIGLKRISEWGRRLCAPSGPPCSGVAWKQGSLLTSQNGMGCKEFINDYLPQCSELLRPWDIFLTLRGEQEGLGNCLDYFSCLPNRREAWRSKPD
jgi:hypothetical protein